MNLWISLASVVVLMACFTSVYSIRCYVCDSNTESDCKSTNTGVLEKHKVDCEPVSGTKAVQFHTLNRCATTKDTDGSVTRSCFYRDTRFQDNACRRGNGATACMCTGDFCNTHGV